MKNRFSFAVLLVLILTGCAICNSKNKSVTFSENENAVFLKDNFRIEMYYLDSNTICIVRIDTLALPDFVILPQQCIEENKITDRAYIEFVWTMINTHHIHKGATFKEGFVEAVDIRLDDVEDPVPVIQRNNIPI